jgi:hypothetical protein
VDWPYAAMVDDITQASRATSTRFARKEPVIAHLQMLCNRHCYVIC